MPEFTWSTESDWDASTNRSGVVTSDVGVRSGEDIALGFDPEAGICADCVGFWSMDDTSTFLTEEIEGNNATVNGATRGVDGPLGTNAVSFDGVDDFTASPVDSDLTGGGSFTVAAWMNKRANSTTIDTIVRNGATFSGTYFIDCREGYGLGFGFYNDAGGVTFDNTFHSDADFLGKHLIIGTYDASADELTVYLDGEGDTYTASATRPAYEGAINFGRSGADNRYFNGDIGFVGLWDRAISSSEAQTLTDTLSTGDLETEEEQVAGEPVDITIDATLPEASGTGGDVSAADHTRESTTSAPQGVNIIPSRDLDGLRLTLPPSSGSYYARNYTECFISEASTPSYDNAIVTKDLSGIGPGDTFDIEVALSSGTDYNIYLHADGSIYYRSAFQQSGQFPYTTPDFEITTGVYSAGNSRSTSNFYNFQGVTALVNDGEPTSATAQVWQTWNNGGTSASETVDIAAGSNTYQLSNFDPEDGSVAVDFELSTPSHLESPEIHSATLTVEESLAPIGTWPLAAGGTVYDAPVYDPDELAAQGYTVGHRVQIDGSTGAFRYDTDDGSSGFVVYSDGSKYLLGLE